MAAAAQLSSISNSHNNKQRQRLVSRRRRRPHRCTLSHLTHCVACLVTCLFSLLVWSNWYALHSLQKQQQPPSQQQPPQKQRQRQQSSSTTVLQKQQPQGQSRQRSFSNASTTTKTNTNTNSQLDPYPWHHNQNLPDDHDGNSIDESDYTFHVVVSSGCNALQDWQSYAFLYQLYAAPDFHGHVTRVASCETAAQGDQLQRIFDEQVTQPMGGDRFHLHVTPDYSHLVEPKYNFFNKPFGLLHWMQHGLDWNDSSFSVHNNDLDKTIIVIMDPDQFYMRPFRVDMRNEPELWVDAHGYRVLKRGQPFAASYAFGGAWINKIDVNDLFQNANLTALEMANSGLHSWTPEFANKHLAIGAPYLAVASDMYNIVQHWAKFVQPLYHQMDQNGKGQGTFMAEMYAYSTAAAHLHLPHQASHSFMISQPVANTGEAWPAWIDSLLESTPGNQVDAHVSRKVCQTNQLEPRPHVFHFCQRYYLGPYFFSKYQVLKETKREIGEFAFLSCEHPLYQEPPDDVAVVYNSSISLDGNFHALTPKDRLRMAFSLCFILKALNGAAAFYKRHHCAGNDATNRSKVFVHETHQAKKERQDREKLQRLQRIQ